MNIAKATSHIQTSQKSKVQPQKKKEKKEISTLQILIIILICLVYVFIQNQESILKQLAQQRADLFSEEQMASQYSQSQQNGQNSFEIYYKQDQLISKNEGEQQIQKQENERSKYEGIKPLFKQLLENKIEQLILKKQSQQIKNEIPKTSWTKINIEDISLGSIQNIISKQKEQQVLKGSQFFGGQMSFIVSLKASANFIQNSLFLEHTMIEQMGKGKQLSKIIDNSFQYILKNTIGFEGISKFVNSQRTINKQIHGIAALKSASKTIRTQFTVDIIYTLVETTIDITKLIRGDIKPRDLAKNIFFNLFSSTGSTIGFTYGTIKFGNSLGGVMGSIAGAFTSNFIAQVVYKEFLSDELIINEEQIIQIVKEIIFNKSQNSDLNMNEMELLLQKVGNAPQLQIDNSFNETSFKSKLEELVLLFIQQIKENRNKVIQQ
ncbi:transmembrane protein, putative (macronuclear) [Tetrahymena thermophila SB210]|uniref:Transmembrane protein, putative n=1 Tax=Tetrahymena thermophila (strain SB210) TaxID=312017 RepID=I7M1K0_TETTS|nr:transmembrane protein, putative [Tetrahymena thermophila SB210]EAR96489.1 transmembrane protein, putative [Tetrahymena thermophila SB210]|eukprot:XP_001016734.1 transmembrane protein, putative [Tetrahymena thermophila SB210]